MSNLTKEKRKQIKKEKKSSQTTCSQCPADLTGLLKQKTFCSFCLNFVCKSHIIKKRKDPIIEDKLAKICQECEDNILYQQIIYKVEFGIIQHQQKEQQLQEETQELQNQLDQLSSNIQGLSTQQSTLNYQINKEQEDFDKKEQRYQQLLKEADNRNETLNDESRVLNEQHRNLMETKKTVELRKQLQQDEYLKAKQEEKLLKETISNLDQQIEAITAEISQLNDDMIKMQQTQPLKQPEVKPSIYSTFHIEDSVHQSKFPKQKSEIRKDRETSSNGFYCFIGKKKQ